MKCPKCHAIVPNSWKTCRCGHDFIAPDKPDITERSESTKPIEPVSKPAYEKKDIQEEYKEHLLKENSYEKTRVLPVEELTTEIKDKDDNTDDGSFSADLDQQEDEKISRRLNFLGNARTLFGIHLLNVFLTIITLGIYYFWGKIKIRKYMYSQSEFEGDRFEFVGTGGELLLGFIKAALLIGLLAFGIEFGKHVYPSVYTEIAGGLVIYLVILLFTPIALVLTQRYRFSRTSWRYIRFSFRGKIQSFLKIYIPGLILTTITLGIYYYYLHHKTRKYLVNHAYFGDTKFSYDGEVNALFGKFIKAIILSLFTIGIYWFWFAAERNNYYWSHTKFANARFRLNIKGFEYFRLKSLNLLLIIFTLGLAYPFVMIRDIRFLFERLRLEGDLDLFDIMQDARSPSAFGEEVADILDLDLAGMGLGI